MARVPPARTGGLSEFGPSRRVTAQNEGLALAFLSVLPYAEPLHPR